MLAFQLSVTECCVCATPAPDSVTFAGDPLALLLIVTLPLSLPAVAGLNCTPIVNAWEGDNVTGVPAPLSVNPVPAMLIPEIVTFAFPVSVIVTICVAELPVFKLPKLSAVVLSEIVVEAAIPLPLSATVLGEFGALLTIESPPLELPVACGANCTLNVLVAPGFRESGRLTVLLVNPLPVTPNCVTVNSPVPLLLN